MYVTVLIISVCNIALESSFSGSVRINGYLISWQMNIGHVIG